MSDLDKMIAQSLRDTDPDLAELSTEPGYFKQAFSLFTGRMAWVHWIMMIAQSALFVVGLWCALNFFQAEQVLDALRWGLPGAVALVFSLTIKSMLVPQMETNRLLMEIKRLELRIERLREEKETV
jgi:hypothetical protein